MLETLFWVYLRHVRYPLTKIFTSNGQPGCVPVTQPKTVIIQIVAKLFFLCVKRRTEQGMDIISKVVTEAFFVTVETT